MRHSKEAFLRSQATKNVTMQVAPVVLLVSAYTGSNLDERGFSSQFRPW